MLATGRASGSLRPFGQGRYSVRKMILIAAFALLSTSTCYANLSLADASQPTNEQPKARSPEEHPVAHERRATISRPRRRHVLVEAQFLSGWTRHCW